MAIMEIVKHPADVLRRKAEPVRKVNAAVRRTLDDMADTMYDAHGVGLAGNQVGIAKRLVVIDVGDGLLQLINPEIVRRSGEMVEDTEGCLSIPGWQGEVPRDNQVQMRATLPNGRMAWFEAEDLFARAIQHEIDHLDGILFLDRASRVYEITAETQAEEGAEPEAAADEAGQAEQTPAAPHEA
ncbi:MAG: peptide deformylase [Thermaerobacter sp.]|nr:peptide deformylase [Thermaerobacter sp.]